MRKYGFGGYSIYRYLVNEALHQGDYFLPWCEETARKTASYWNTSLEDVTRIVKGCIQVGLFNGGGHTAELSKDLLHAFPASQHIRRAGACGQLIHKTIIHFK